MTTVHPQLVGESVLVPRTEWETVIELARRSDEVNVLPVEAELTTRTIMQLADKGGAFHFWREAGEEIYSANDGEPV